MKHTAISKNACFCIALCRASDALTAYYDERLARLGITVKQYSLLSSLAKLGEASTSELAEYVNLERTTLTRNLSVLAAKGWMRDQAAAGTRAHRYRVTEDGARMLESAESVWQGVQAQVRALLGEDQLGHFMENLNRLQALKLDPQSTRLKNA